MALHWPVLTATQVWTTNGNGDTSTGSARDPQRHQWIKADWLRMTPFCWFSLLFLIVHLWSWIFYVFIYIFSLCSFCFCPFALVKQNCRIKKSASSRFWKDTLEVVQVIWSVHFWPQVISKSRSSFWPREDEAKVFGAFWCRPCRHSLADIKHWECKTIREQRHEKRNGKNAVNICQYYSHIGAHNNMLQPLMIRWTKNTLFIGPVRCHQAIAMNIY